MPRKKKAYGVVKVAEPSRIAEPKVSDGIFYAIILSVLVVFISGAYYKSSGCAYCQGENVANGYPYQWFSYNTYEGWQGGSINWLGAILDLIFWAFIAWVVMLVLYAAIKEI
jgi:ABC-type multidrug transport system permease subunit